MRSTFLCFTGLENRQKKPMTHLVNEAITEYIAARAAHYNPPDKLA